MNDLLRAALEQSGAPGFGAMASDSHATLAHEVAGVRRVGSEAAIATTDRFHLGSNAKAMTATLAALAVEDSVLTWETDAADVLPDVCRMGATLVALLSHSAGLGAYAEDEELDAVPPLEGNAAEQRLAFARRALAEEPLFDAGAEHRYSNAGYAVAAAMLEEVRGEPWEDQLRDRLFAPLQIEGGIGWPARDDTDQPWGHFADGDRFRPHDPTDDYQLPTFLRPAGDVNASLDGYARFLRFHLRGMRGEAELLDVESFQRLHRPIGGTNFALGWGVQDLQGVRTSVHTGSAETFYAVVAIQPDRDLTVAVVANAAGEAVEIAAATALKGALAAFTAP